MPSVATIIKMIRQESPARLEMGTVVSVDSRGIRQVTVRLSGGRTISRPYMCVDDLEVGDPVIAAHMEGLDRMVIISRVLDDYSSDLSKQGVLAPPANLAVTGYPMAIHTEWENYPGEGLSYIVEESDDGGTTGTQMLVTQGSYYLHLCTVEADHAPETWHFRVRALRWLGDNNVQYSGWSAWTSGTSITWDERYYREDELSSAACDGLHGASLIWICDADDNFPSTVSDVELALDYLAETGGGAHDLFSATHEDTVAAAVLQGYIPRGNATPKWERYDAKTNHFILVGDGTDIESKAFDWDDMAAGAAADVVHDHSAAGEGDVIPGTSVELEEVGAATHDDVQDWTNLTQSAGKTSLADSITDAGGGQINVAAGTGLVKATNSEIGVTEFLDWDAAGPLTLANDAMSWIFIAADGSVSSISDYGAITHTNQFTIGRVYREDNDLHILNSGTFIYDAVRRMHRRVRELRAVERASGAVSSEPGAPSLNLKVTAGVLYSGVDRFTTDQFDSSGADRFQYWYHDGAGDWVHGAHDQDVIDNLQYDTGTGLDNLLPNRYGVFWVFLHTDEAPLAHIDIVYGQDNYKLGEAEDSVVPGDLPDLLDSMAILIARIIVEQNDTAFTEIETAFETIFPVASPTVHNDLAGLNDGDYQHLTAAQYTPVRGDIYYGDATPAMARLPIGAGAFILRSDGVDPSWVNPALHVPTPPVAEGDILYAGPAPAWIRLARGAAGTVLQMGAFQIPTWVSPDTIPTAPGGAGRCLQSTAATWESTATPLWPSRWYFEAGISFAGATGANVILVPDAVADALEIVDDTTGDEYLGFRTAAQKAVVINEDGVDIDLVVEATGVADAFVVQGSDGEVTLGALGAGHLSASAAGVIASSPDITLAAGNDVFPDNDGRGLFARVVNRRGIAAYYDHFRSGVIPGGYAWQGGAFGGNPASLNYSAADDYLWGTATGAGVRHFLSTAVTNVAASWQGKSTFGRIRTGITTEIGFRLDDGTDNNYAEIYTTGVLANATQRVDFRFRTGGGGINTVASGLIIPCDTFISVLLFCYWSGANYQVLGYVTAEDGPDINIAGFTTGVVVWPPAAGRVGIMIKNAGNVGAVDWFDEDFG